MTDIRNFVETATCSTITQAAIKLEISQPALSESLKNLEEMLGRTLFYRSRTGIKLTPNGKLFLDKAKDLLSSYQNLDFTEDDKTVFGKQIISIGCHPTVATYFVPDTMKELRKSAPDFNISLIHDLSRNIQIEIQKGNIDLGIIVNAVRVPDLVIQNISSDTVRVWRNSNQSLDTIICNTDLFQTQSILKKWKDKPSKIISTNSLELICQMTEEGLGYGIIPEKAVEISRVKLKKMTNLPVYNDQFYLVYRPEFGKTKAERVTIDAIKKAFSN